MLPCIFRFQKGVNKTHRVVKNENLFVIKVTFN